MSLKSIFSMISIYFCCALSFAQAPYTTPDNRSSGNCLSFDGINDGVMVPNHTSLQITANLTVEGWINNNAASGGDRDWISKHTATNANLVGFRFQTNGGGAISFNVGNGPGTAKGASSTIPINEWHHVAGTYDGSNVLLYIDGALAASNTGAVMGNNSQPLYIGDFFDNGTFFMGQIDEVRIWNVVRTQAQIRDNMCRTLTGSEPNLAAYWRMNQGSGGTITDLTTNGNDGTLY